MTGRELIQLILEKKLEDETLYVPFGGKKDKDGSLEVLIPYAIDNRNFLLCLQGKYKEE